MGNLITVPQGGMRRRRAAMVKAARQMDWDEFDPPSVCTEVDQGTGVLPLRNLPRTAAWRGLTEFPPPTATDELFSGSLPEIYDRLLVPLRFESYARDLAARIAKVSLRDVL